MRLRFQEIFLLLFVFLYHLSNSRGGWNKRGGGTKVAKSINVEARIIEEVGRNLRKL